MQHINSERIAALADEPATLIERTHLTECVSCNAELAAAQRLVHMALTDIPAIERPLTSWERLGPALKAEGLIHSGEFEVVSKPDIVPIRAQRATSSRWMLQAAAGVFLLLGGAVVGRASVGLSTGTPRGSDVAAANPSTDTNFSSTADAMSALQRSSNDYQRAITYLAVNDTSAALRSSDANEMYSARLDAIEKTIAAARTGLLRAPQDPVLNSYYLQSVGARNLTLRQMGAAVPVSMTKRTKF